MKLIFCIGVSDGDRKESVVFVCGWLYNEFIEERGVVKMKVIVSLIVDKESGELDLIVGEKRLKEGDKKFIGCVDNEVVVCGIGNSGGIGSDVRKLLMKLKDDNSDFEYKGWLKGFNRIESEIRKYVCKEGCVVKLVRWSVEYDDNVSVIVE